MPTKNVQISLTADLFENQNMSRYASHECPIGLAGLKLGMKPAVGVHWMRDYQNKQDYEIENGYGTSKFLSDCETAKSMNFATDWVVREITLIPIKK